MRISTSSSLESELEPQLRLATLDDIPELADLIRRSIQVLGPNFYTAAETEAAARCLSKPDADIISDGTYYVVENLGKTIGCGGWSRRQKLYTGSTGQEDLSNLWLDPKTDAAKIRSMFVDANYARRGIGLMIYGACERAAFAFGFRRLELMATMPGVPFYRSLGFVGDDVENIDLSDGTALPGIRMYKNIPEISS